MCGLVGTPQGKQLTFISRNKEFISSRFIQRWIYFGNRENILQPFTRHLALYAKLLLRFPQPDFPSIPFQISMPFFSCSHRTTTMLLFDKKQNSLSGSCLLCGCSILGNNQCPIIGEHIRQGFEGYRTVIDMVIEPYHLWQIWQSGYRQGSEACRLQNISGRASRIQNGYRHGSEAGRLQNRCQQLYIGRLDTRTAVKLLKQLKKMKYILVQRGPAQASLVQPSQLSLTVTLFDSLYL